jgi:GAF domain-containing protein
LFAGVGPICEAVMQQTDADGVALAVLSRSRRVRELVYATDPLAQQLDELQYTVGEGPCFDAYLHDAPQCYPELNDVAETSRWPVFAAGATELGAHALWAIPVPDGSRPMGVLEFYRRATGGLADSEMAAACASASAIAHQLESNWREHRARFGSVEQAIDAAAVSDSRAEPIDPFTRTQVHVAAGMASIQLGVSTDEALDRLRAHAYASARPLSSVAADIIARRATLQDQDDVSSE